MATARPRSVLITGCSDGGTGSALAIEFCNAGLHVYATARDVSKMKNLEPHESITLMALDIESETSISQCVGQIPALDILVNNAGASYTMAISDVSISAAKKLFDTNVWGHIALTQALLPLLLESSAKHPNNNKNNEAVIANHTSVGSGFGLPFQAAYNASKAAFSMFSDIMRLELQPFDITVVNLKTAGVKTNVIKNLQSSHPELPEGSIYAPAKELVEKLLRLEWSEGIGITPEEWAKGVVKDLLKKSPPAYIWRGQSALTTRIASFLPSVQLDGTVKKMTGLDKIEAVLRKKPASVTGASA